MKRLIFGTLQYGIIFTKCTRVFKIASTSILDDYEELQHHFLKVSYNTVHYRGPKKNIL